MAPCRTTDELIVRDNSLIGHDHAFVGKEPTAQPVFPCVRLLFEQRVDEYMPGNHRNFHFLLLLDARRLVNERFAREIRGGL